MAAAGLGPEKMLTTVEYVCPDGLGQYRDVAGVRAEKLRSPYPASTGIVCGGLLRDEFLLEVVPTATTTEGSAMGLLTDELRARIGEKAVVHRAGGAGSRGDPLLRARRRRLQPALRRQGRGEPRRATAT